MFTVVKKRGWVVIVPYSEHAYYIFSVVPRPSHTAAKKAVWEGLDMNEVTYMYIMLAVPK